MVSLLLKCTSFSVTAIKKLYIKNSTRLNLGRSLELVYDLVSGDPLKYYNIVLKF